MEVGAVKQAFNNELILLKKKLNQAKIQIIHKLTRKAKTLTEKKCPEPLKEKLKRKAASAVTEVLIIKKINPKDLARFAVTHKGKLQEYLNKPNVNQDRACARLLLHKSLQDKYNLLRTKFSSLPIEELLMSREERKKIKKEAREKQKNKKKVKENGKVVNAEGDWEVEDVVAPSNKKIDGADNNENLSDEHMSEDEEEPVEDKLDGDLSNNNLDIVQDDNIIIGNVNSDEESEKEISSDEDVEESLNEEPENSSNSDSEGNELPNVGQFVKITPSKRIQDNIIVKGKEEIKKKPSTKLESKVIKKAKPSKPDKNKNLNEKLLSRKFKKELSEDVPVESKIVDPFFITSTGENYMTIVEPRQPDEVKEVHKQGNRKLRRAVMFGHELRVKPRYNKFKEEDNRFNRQNGFNKNTDSKRFNGNDKFGNDRQNNDKFNDKRSRFNKNETEETKPEKLHPSWEAKKKQSGILPFQGKKIVFDDS